MPFSSDEILEEFESVSYYGKANHTDQQERWNNRQWWKVEGGPIYRREERARLNVERQAAIEAADPTICNPLVKNWRKCEHCKRKRAELAKQRREHALRQKTIREEVWIKRKAELAMSMTQEKMRVAVLASETPEQTQARIARYNIATMTHAEVYDLAVTKFGDTVALLPLGSRCIIGRWVTQSDASATSQVLLQGGDPSRKVLQVISEGTSWREAASRAGLLSAEDAPETALNGTGDHGPQNGASPSKAILVGMQAGKTSPTKRIR